jgi:tRNA pseudouridine38-40 synthase
VHVRRPLDVEAMEDAARALVGTHDVAAFRAVGCAARTTVRTIEACGVRREGPLVHLEIVGNGFLRHMVRIVAGTLQPVGHGEAPRDALAVALRAGRRDAAGPTAPPHGLCLVEVRYDGPGVPSDDDDEPGFDQ